MSWFERDEPLLDLCKGIPSEDMPTGLRQSMIDLKVMLGEIEVCL